MPRVHVIRWVQAVLEVRVAVTGAVNGVVGEAGRSAFRWPTSHARGYDYLEGETLWLPTIAVVFTLSITSISRVGVSGLGSEARFGRGHVTASRLNRGPGRVLELKKFDRPFSPTTIVSHFV